jgi:hypothetical protein
MFGEYREGARRKYERLGGVAMASKRRERRCVRRQVMMTTNKKLDAMADR